MLYCKRCNKYTKSIEPVIIFKNDFFSFRVATLCYDCYYTKAKYLSPVEMRKLPEDFKKIPLKQNFINYVFLDNKRTEIFPYVEKIINT
jgi:hypothetical protein